MRRAEQAMIFREFPYHGCGLWWHDPQARVSANANSDTHSDGYTDGYTNAKCDPISNSNAPGYANSYTKRNTDSKASPDSKTHPDSKAAPYSAALNACQGQTAPRAAAPANSVTPNSYANKHYENDKS